MIRRLSLAISALLLIVSAGVVVFHVVNLDRGQGTSIQIGGPFTMRDQDGQIITKQDLDQSAVALFAGFTHCPDVCPTTLLRISNLMKLLGEDAKKIRVVLVSVDPERDTPQVLKSYLAAFEGDFTGMTGTPEQLKNFAKAYRLFYKKSGIGSDYLMDHSAGVYLFKRGGAFQGTLDQHEPDDVALRKLKMLTGD
jgi:protein SCO1/2